MTEPILTFFFTSKDLVEKSIVTSDGLNVYSLQFPIYSDYERSKHLGALTCQGMDTKIIDQTSSDFIALSEGCLISINDSPNTISYLTSGKFIKKIFQNTGPLIFRVTSGQGDYVLTNGYVVINPFENGDRTCYVYSTN